MLDQNIKTQLKAYLERLESPIELVAALDESIYELSVCLT